MGGGGRLQWLPDKDPFASQILGGLDLVLAGCLHRQAPGSRNCREGRSLYFPSPIQETMGVKVFLFGPPSHCLRRVNDGSGRRRGRCGAEDRAQEVSMDTAESLGWWCPRGRWR